MLGFLYGQRATLWLQHRKPPRTKAGLPRCINGHCHGAPEQCGALAGRAWLITRGTRRSAWARESHGAWEDALRVFNRRARVEGAWGDQTPRVISMNQFKSKLWTLRGSFRAKRRELMSLRPPFQSDTYRDMPRDILHTGESARDGAVCAPHKVHPSYVNILGIEHAALWPLLYSVFSHPTEETQTESGARRVSTDTSDFGVSSDDSLVNYGDENIPNSDDDEGSWVDCDGGSRKKPGYVWQSIFGKVREEPLKDQAVPGPETSAINHNVASESGCENSAHQQQQQQSTDTTLQKAVESLTATIQSTTEKQKTIAAMQHKANVLLNQTLKVIEEAVKLQQAANRPSQWSLIAFQQVSNVATELLAATKKTPRSS